MLEKLEQCVSGNFIGTVENFDRESDLVFMTGFAVSQIRMKCTYLAVSLESSLHSFYKKEKKTWQQCCEESIAVMEDIPMGISPIIRWRTVMDWFASFRDNGRKFIVPSVSLKDKARVPAVFTVYPDFKDACMEFIDNNLGDISTATVHKYMNTCLKVIIDHDAIFIDSDSDDEEECIGNRDEHVIVNDKTLIEKFRDVADNVFEKANKKRKKNLLLKGLMKIEEFNADKSFIHAS